MLSLYKLEIFNAVAQENSFSRAAERLYMTQAAVSQHIHDLEIALGAQLFVRKPLGVQLTEAGIRLLDYTKEILRLVAQAESELTQVANLPHGTLLISALPQAAALVLPPCIQDFQRRYPQLTVSVHPETSETIIEKVAAGMFDIGIIDTPHKDKRLTVIELHGLEPGVVVSQEHPWHSLSSIPISALNGQPFIGRTARYFARAWTSQLFARFNVAPQIIAEIDETGQILAAVRGQCAATILPRELLRGAQDYHFLILADAGEINQPLYLILPAAEPVGAIARAFLAVIPAEIAGLERFLSKH